MMRIRPGHSRWSRARLLGAFGSHIFGSRGVEIGADLILYGWPIIRRAPGSRITLGHSVVLTSDPAATALGVAHPVVIRTLAASARIEVGNHVGMSGTTICAVEAVVIGAECLIGADVKIVDTDFHPLEPDQRRFAPVTAARHAPVTIGHNVFLGANTIVLKGVTIGDNSVIGCGSVVTRSIPRDCIATGNPCRVLRKL